jgi:EAL domain-containing protein (putative c-di-GMP-specific phosphodiesterase class I)
MEMELTESVLMEVTEQHRAALGALRDLGIRLAIDDFGTGYSSLHYLAHYPVSRLKLAQELVSACTSDADKFTIIRAALKLAGELGIDFIAEGVETAVQVALLASAGCRFVQGYYFGRPRDAASTSVLLRMQATPSLVFGEPAGDAAAVPTGPARGARSH